jgi:peptidoglycan hydrolase-like protein with peptidoglycan-binding domain
MNARTFPAALAALTLSFSVSFSALAEDSAAVTTVKLAQEQLHHAGFYSGRIDGNLAGDTQAALAQFQLSRQIPASGSLDETTLAALRVERETEVAAAAEPSAAAGGSAPAEKEGAK